MGKPPPPSTLALLFFSSSSLSLLFFSIFSSAFCDSLTLFFCSLLTLPLFSSL